MALGGRWFLRSLPPPSCLFLFCPRLIRSRCNPLLRTRRRIPRTSSESVRNPLGFRGTRSSHSKRKAQCSLSCNGTLGLGFRTRNRCFPFLLSCCFLSQPDKYIIAYSRGIATPREIFLPAGVWGVFACQPVSPQFPLSPRGGRTLPRRAIRRVLRVLPRLRFAMLLCSCCFPFST